MQWKEHHHPARGEKSRGNVKLTILWRGQASSTLRPLKCDSGTLYHWTRSNVYNFTKWHYLKVKSHYNIWHQRI